MKTLSCLISVIFLLSCKNSGKNDIIIPETPYQYQQPQSFDDGWTVADANQMGIDTKPIEMMMDDISKGEYTGIDSVLIVKSGSLIHEAYFNNFDRNQRHDLRSATKSITSILVGLAIQHQFIQSVDDKVYPFFSEYDDFERWDERKRDISVKHLLTMSPGWDCNDMRSSSAGNEERMYNRSDWIKFILDLPVENNPGNTYGYCTGGVVTLGGILHQSTGIKADEFAAQYLFEPLGITDYNWEYTPAGQVDTGGHIHFKPRDMAKIGQLMLNGGTWNDNTILNGNWVEESTGFHVSTERGQEYGYLWWKGIFSVNEQQFATYYASGNGGQFIFVVPSIETVVVFTGSNYNSMKASQPFEMMRRYILTNLVD